MGLEGAVKLGYEKLEAIKNPKKRIAAYEKMVEDSYKEVEQLIWHRILG